MEWTTEAPTQDGLYWAWFAREKYAHWVVVDVGCVTVSGPYDDEDFRVDQYMSKEGITHWMGPIPEPEPPQ